MHSVRHIKSTLLLIICAGVLFVSGCESGAVAVKGKKRPPGSGGDEAEVARVPIAAAKYGTITGKVIYDGTPPTPRPIEMGQTVAVCHAAPPNQAENFEEQWLVDPTTKGVKNVVVFLQPTAGKFFELPDNLEKSQADVKISQPRCAFIPRVFVLWPSYYDKATAAQKETGQKLIIINDSNLTEHNSKLITNSDENQGFNRTLKKGGDEATLSSLRPQARPLTIMCDIHNWMRCYGFVLEHPYWAITKDDGTFTIENAPLDVPVQVVAWHEAAGFFNGGEEGKTMTLQDKQALDYKIKSR
jgi:hypothetical protein